MKQAIFLLASLVTFFSCFAQEITSETPKPVLTKDEYLKKSRGQKTGAIVLISAGGVLTIVGMAVAVNNFEIDFGGTYGSSNQTDNSNETLSGVLVIGGLAAMLGSIPLFVSSHRNKKRALQLSFINEPALHLQKSMVFYKAVPSVKLKIGL